MNRLITACAVDSSACPKRQAVFLRVSNEPCTSKSKHGRVELARKRQGFDLDVYGECRDSERT